MDGASQFNSPPIYKRLIRWLWTGIIEITAGGNCARRAKGPKCGAGREEMDRNIEQEWK